VFYNRSNEAAARLKPGDFDWPKIFAGGVRWFHSGGIFASLSQTTPELIIEAMRAAKAAGAVVSFDLNFREKLWRIFGGLERFGGLSTTSTSSSATRRTCRRAWALSVQKWHPLRPSSIRQRFSG
jgi:sugar/nucleoside kinase (ribokinase family)